MEIENMSFNASCDKALDRITVEILRADVTDPEEIKTLCENARALRTAKEHNEFWLWRWLGQISPNDILKLAFSGFMWFALRHWEDDGFVITSRSQNFIPWNKSPR